MARGLTEFTVQQATNFEAFSDWNFQAIDVSGDSLDEDAMDMEAKAYFLREFRAIVERHESSKSWGSRRVIPGAHSIR